MNKNLFDNIDKNKCKRVFFWKYCYQLVIMPTFYGLIASVCIFIFEVAYAGWDVAVADLFLTPVNIWFVSGSIFFIFQIVITLLDILAQFLSLQTFINLVIDLIFGNNDKSKDIEFIRMNVPYEFFVERPNYMNFSCDRFSKKKHLSLYLYDENNKKYRFFWNEKFSTMPLSQVKEEIYKASRLRISYLKHSKIIFKCEVIEYKSIYTHTKA